MKPRKIDAADLDFLAKDPEPDPVGGDMDFQVTPIPTNLLHFDPQSMAQFLKGGIVNYNPDNCGVASFYLFKESSSGSSPGKEMTLVCWLSMTTFAHKEAIPAHLNISEWWKRLASTLRPIFTASPHVMEGMIEQIDHAAAIIDAAKAYSLILVIHHAIPDDPQSLYFKRFFSAVVFAHEDIYPGLRKTYIFDESQPESELKLFEEDDIPTSEPSRLPGHKGGDNECVSLLSAPNHPLAAELPTKPKGQKASYPRRDRTIKYQ